MACSAVRQWASTLPLPCQAGSPTTKIAALPRDSSMLAAKLLLAGCCGLGVLGVYGSISSTLFELLFKGGLDRFLDHVAGPGQVVSVLDLVGVVLHVLGEFLLFFGDVFGGQVEAFSEELLDGLVDRRLRLAFLLFGRRGFERHQEAV